MSSDVRPRDTASGTPCGLVALFDGEPEDYWNIHLPQQAVKFGRVGALLAHFFPRFP
jgi:hypothetical protein